MTVAQWSSTAGLNVLSSGTSGTGGVNIDEGMAPSGVNNAIRDIMAQWATFITDANFTLTSTDAGASANPTLTLYRNSASPAASDLTGKILFQGKDSGGNVTEYANILSLITDPTNGSEDASLTFQNVVAGTLRSTLSMGAGTLTLSDFDAGTAIGPTLSLYRSSASPAASDIIGVASFVGKDSGGNDTTYASLFGRILDTTDGSEDGGLGIQVMVGGTPTTAAAWNSSTLRLWQDSTSTPGAGNNTTGHAFDNGGGVYHSSAGAALNVNRTADGNVAGFYSGGTVQGVISIAGATVTYGAFSGSHWSQLSDGSKVDDIPRGTIVESIDKLCTWPGEVNERLPCFKVSDTQKSKRVYGVFGWWDQDEGPTNDAFIISLGAYLIRIEKGEKVEGGDLIESAGNGCGRVQNNDAMRSSTVAKVTSTEVVDRFPDGSFTVPCTLHCG